MDPRDDRHDRHDRHEIGRRVYVVADVDPLDLDGVRTVAVGSALWLLVFLGLLPFWSPLQESGRGWWIWTCMAGVSLGLFGLEYCRRRRTARESEVTDPEPTAPSDEPTSDGPPPGNPRLDRPSPDRRSRDARPPRGGRRRA